MWEQPLELQFSCALKFLCVRRLRIESKQFCLFLEKDTKINKRLIRLEEHLYNKEKKKMNKKAFSDTDILDIKKTMGHPTLKGGV